MTPIEHYWEPDRYEPEQMPPDDRGRRPWRLRDALSQTGWAEGPLNLDGLRGPLEFSMKELAEEWIGRLRYTTEGRVRVQ